LSEFNVNQGNLQETENGSALGLIGRKGEYASVAHKNSSRRATVDRRKESECAIGKSERDAVSPQDKVVNIEYASAVDRQRAQCLIKLLRRRRCERNLWRRRGALRRFEPRCSVSREKNSEPKNYNGSHGFDSNNTYVMQQAARANSALPHFLVKKGRGEDRR
jgi:hypothetical protein